MSVRWFDSHLHLDAYPEAERPRIVARAHRAGVDQMLTIRDPREATMVLPGVFEAIGLHPIRPAVGLDHAVLLEAATAPQVIAIGETGFDRTGPDYEIQAALFGTHVDVARELALPVVLHVAAPWDELEARLETLEGLTVVRHYFTGDAAQARWHADRGHYLSFGRPLLRDASLQAIAATYPAHHLLIETDSYPLPGRTTEPRDLPEVGEKLGALRGWTEPANQLWENSVAAFGLL